MHQMRNTPEDIEDRAAAGSNDDAVFALQNEAKGDVQCSEMFRPVPGCSAMFQFGARNTDCAKRSQPALLEVTTHGRAGGWVCEGLPASVIQCPL